MIERYLSSSSLEALHQLLGQNQSLILEGLWDSPKALVTTIAQQATGKNVLLLTGSNQEGSRLYHDLQYFSEREILYFPAWETLPNEGVAPSPDIVGERYQILKRILEKKEPLLIISNLQACLQKLLAPKRFDNLYLSLQVGQTYSYEALIQRLISMGYERRPVASDKGEFAVRGGIIDLFPVSTPEPIRIEFWGDEIDSLRTFDPIGQQSIQTISSSLVTPAKELQLINEENELTTIFDYLKENTLLVFDDLIALEDRYCSLKALSTAKVRTFSDVEELLDQASSLQKIFFAEHAIEEMSAVRVVEKSKSGYYSANALPKKLGFQLFNREFEAFRASNPFTSISDYLLPERDQEISVNSEELMLSLQKLTLDDYSLLFLCSSESEKNHLQQKNLKLPEKTEYEIGYLSAGFALHDYKFVIFPTSEMTHHVKIRRQKQRSTYHTAPTDTYELSPGEIVVHLNNGIGKFVGLEKRPNHLGIESEFFLVEYADQAKLYVPINQAHLVSKYIGSDEHVPKLHALGSARWKRTKELTEHAILGYASELLKLQAKRSLEKGFAYPADGPDILSFEEEFPFVETEDQLQAVAAIKADMCQPKVMDRLICGDVGYGKTEVAMRAAFKAAVDGGKQVAVLVPTTVLAMQHYENFCNRMRNFPVRIGVLSRFRTAKQTKQTLEDVKKGLVDILIGTHRLISKDVVFDHLGLVIIDEEQRFGVKAKEHLKAIRENVDCLTLSATPIPRTLYMSLVGVREMSIINTPPQDRLPIKTIIAEPDDVLLKNAILRELTRDGQVYFIHNRVESIPQVADRIKTLLPEARVGTVHGQMNSDEIDEVFHAFKNGYIDVLVATSIIESGIDIPNANTILIDRADRFGLADLYQMRGRVGRWNRRAYAYFLIPRFYALPELSKKRLNALAEASGYGGGMKLAMRDLEIRGAGNMLGVEQSGHVSAIGFHLYCKLLKRTLKTLEGKIPSILTDVKIEIPVDARLPENYVNETALRMEIYQKLGEATSWDELETIWKELRDRFGPQPPQAEWLYHVTRLRVYASLHGYTLVKVDKLSLFTERKIGTEMTSKQQLLGKFSTPQQMEQKILTLLN